MRKLSGQTIEKMRRESLLDQGPNKGKLTMDEAYQGDGRLRFANPQPQDAKLTGPKPKGNK